MMESTCGILPVLDLDRTADFYSKLGFTETGRWTGHGYLIVVRDKIEIHFARNPEHVPEESDHAIYIRTTDVDGLSSEFEKLGLKPGEIPGFRAAEDKSWEMRELHVLDPDGHLLRIGQFM